MKVTVSKVALQDAVLMVSAATTSKDLGDVLGSISLQADMLDQTLRVTCVGALMALTTTLDAKVDAGGGCLVPAAVLGGVVRAAPGADVSMEILQNQLVFLGKGSKSGCVILHEDQYPYPTLEAPQLIGTIDSKPLIEAIARSSRCVMKGLTGSLFGGIRLRSHNGAISLAGCDGSRAVLNEVGEGEQEFCGVLTTKAAGVISRLATRADVIEFSGDENRLGAKSGGFAMRSLLVSGSYAEVEKLYPEEVSTQATVTTVELVSAMERVKAIAKIAAKDVIQLVKMTTGEDYFSIEYASAAGSTTERIPAIVGGDLIVGVEINWAFLNDIAEFSSEDALTISFVKEKNNAMYVVEGPWKYIAMPVRRT